MKISTAAVAASFVLLTACAHKRTPTDAQLIALLHSDRPSAASTIDSSTANCLRAWSGDDKLTAGLPLSLTTQAPAKASCKVRLDAWIGDAQRNSEHFTFEEVSAPPVVTRVVALSEASLAAMSANDKIPPSLQAKPPVAMPPLMPSALPPPDLGPAGRDLAHAEDLCAQVQKKAANAAANEPIKRFADDCSASLRRIRGTMEQAARSNPSQERLRAIAEDSANFTAIAQQFLSSN